MTTAVSKASGEKGKKAASLPSQASSATQGAGTPLNMMWEEGPRVAKAVPVFTAAGMMDFSHPFLVTSSLWARSVWKQGSPIRSAADAFVEKFDMDDIKKTHGRASKPIKDEVLHGRVAEHLGTYFLPDGLKSMSCESWKSLKKASTFAVVQNFSKTIFEPDGVASVRLHCLGTKSVLLAPVMAIHSVMKDLCKHKTHERAHTHMNKRFLLQTEI